MIIQIRGIFNSWRPTFGREHFYKAMKRLKKSVLIRSHDPRAKRSMFNNKCLTLFSSCAYGTERIVALADFTNGKRIKSVDDLVIETI